MKNKLSSLILAITLFISGCFGLVEMAQVERVSAPGADEVLVNFVRSSFLYQSGGISYDLWHGARFIGTLNEGRMVQYKMDPGEHVFMVNSHGNGWDFFKFRFAAGTTHYIKTGVPFIGNVSFELISPSDPNVSGWNKSLKTVGIDPNKAKEIPPEVQREAVAKLAEFNSGKSMKE